MFLAISFQFLAISFQFLANKQYPNKPGVFMGLYLFMIAAIQCLICLSPYGVLHEIPSQDTYETMTSPIYRGK